jgi:hypothetical protein
MRRAELRYDDGLGDYNQTKPGLDPDEVAAITIALNTQQQGQVTPDQVLANQNNYALPAGELIRLSTDASRTFTGFAGARPGVFVVANVGVFDVVIAHQNAGSDAQNRVICHTGANITLNADESVSIIYDFSSLRWRTVGFA